MELLLNLIVFLPILVVLVALIIFFVLIVSKMKGGKKIGYLSFSSLGILFLLLVLHVCTAGILSPLPYRHLAPFFGKVVDADTQEPIAGAAVLAVYQSSWCSPAGEISDLVDGQEALTDEEGEFRIPAKTRWFFAVYRGYPRGNITIFKPGYGVFPDHKRSEAVGVNKSWPPPKRYILYELPKLKTIEERKKNAGYRRGYYEIPYDRRKLYIKTINEECKEVGIPLLHIPDEEGKK